MKEKKHLTPDEIHEITKKIGEPTFKFFNKSMEKQIKNILEKNEIYKYDIIHITTATIFDLLINVFSNVQKFINKECLKKVDFNEIVKLYSKALIEHFEEHKKDTIN